MDRGIFLKYAVCVRKLFRALPDQFLQIIDLVGFPTR